MSLRSCILSLGFLILSACGGGQSDSLVGKAEAPELPEPPTEIEIVDIDPSLLKEGGYVLFFRHTTRDPEAADLDMNFIDRNGICVVGSQLNAQGEAEARKLGEVFRAQEYLVGDIYTSPSCRTKQMSELAFGTTGDVVLWAGRPPTWAADEVESMNTELINHLATEPPAGTNTLILSHGSLYDSIFKVNYNLLQGDAGVYKPVGDGNYEFVGLLRKEVWIQL